LSSLDKAEVISNAMSLRGFGKHKRRSWYNIRPLRVSDYMVFAGMILFLIPVIYARISVDALFWYPW
jgi:energy-coupling factor transport system permease protein